MKAVQFSAVPIGGWFKVVNDGSWHLKTRSDKGLYQSFGTSYEPYFKGTETVFVDIVDFDGIRARHQQSKEITQEGVQAEDESDAISECGNTPYDEGPFTFAPLPNTEIQATA